MKTTNYRGIIGFTVLYAVTSFACAFTDIQGATEELNAAYAQGLEQLSGVWGLALAIAATAVAAYLGVRIRLRLV